MFMSGRCPANFDFSIRFEAYPAQAVQEAVNQVGKFGKATDEKGARGGEIRPEMEQLHQRLGPFLYSSQAAQGRGPQKRIPEELGHLEGQGFLVGFLTPLLKIKGKNTAPYGTTPGSGDSTRSPFPGWPDPCSHSPYRARSQPRKPMSGGSVGVEAQGNFSFRQKQLPLIAEEMHLGQGSPDHLVLRFQEHALFGPRPGPFLGVTPWALIAGSSFGHRERPADSRPDRPPDPASRLAPAHPGSRQSSRDSRSWHGGKISRWPHRSRETLGASGGTLGTGSEG